MDSINVFSQLKSKPDDDRLIVLDSRSQHNKPFFFLFCRTIVDHDDLLLWPPCLVQTGTKPYQVTNTFFSQVKTTIVDHDDLLLWPPCMIQTGTKPYQVRKTKSGVYSVPTPKWFR